MRSLDRMLDCSYVVGTIRGPALIRIHALGTEVRTAGVAGSWARTWARPVSAFYILSFRAGRAARARREASGESERERHLARQIQDHDQLKYLVRGLT